MFSEKYDSSFEKRIYETLTSLGVPIRMQGHRYMEDALDILLRDPEARYAFVKRVYHPVAEKYGVTGKQVESAIRTAISSAWKSGNCEYYERIFGYSRNTGDRPCNSEFLLRVLTVLRLML